MCSWSRNISNTAIELNTTLADRLLPRMSVYVVYVTIIVSSGIQ